MITIHSDGSVYNDQIERLKSEVRRRTADACKIIRQIDVSNIEIPDVDLQEEIAILESLICSLEDSKR